MSNFGFKQGRGLKASVAQLSTQTSVECPPGVSTILIPISISLLRDTYYLE